jgi:hypothetical protein
MGGDEEVWREQPAVFSADSQVRESRFGQYRQIQKETYTYCKQPC